MLKNPHCNGFFKNTNRVISVAASLHTILGYAVLLQEAHTIVKEFINCLWYFGESSRILGIFIGVPLLYSVQAAIAVASYSHLWGQSQSCPQVQEFYMTKFNEAICIHFVKMSKMPLFLSWMEQISDILLLAEVRFESETQISYDHSKVSTNTINNIISFIFEFQLMLASCIKTCI